MRRRVHRIRAAAAAAVAAYASAQKPARLSDPWSPSWKHSPVVIVVSPPSLRVPRIEAISSVARAGKSVRVHAARNSESSSWSSAGRRTARWENARWRLLHSVGDFACRAKCAAIEIIKRERASATREKETGDSLFLLTVLLCAGCIRESAIRIRPPLLKCLAQIPTPCCASVATRLRVGKWVVISRCAITPLSSGYRAAEKKSDRQDDVVKIPRNYFLSSSCLSVSLFLFFAEFSFSLILSFFHLDSEEQFSSSPIVSVI